MNECAVKVCDSLMNANFLYQANTHHVLGAGPQQ